MMGPSNPSYPGSYTSTITQDWQERRIQDNLHLSLSSLEQSSLLYESCIDDEALQLNAETDITQATGSALIGQLESLVTVASGLYRIITIARKENTSLITTTVTLGTGLAAIWQGQIPWGLALTGAALNEVRKIVMEGFQTAGTAKDLAGEIKAGVLMIHQLEEYQKTSLDTINQHLHLLEGQLDDIEKQFTNINNLAVEGSKDGEMKKQEAIKLSHETAKAYRQAIFDLEQSREGISAVSAEFNSIIQELQSLIEGTKSAELQPEDFANFVDQTQGILEKMIQAQNKLSQNQNLFNQGLRGVHEASELNKEVLGKHFEIQAVMQQYFHQIQMQANMNNVESARNETKGALEEVAITKQRAEDIQAIAQHEVKKSEELENVLEDQWGNTSMLFGAVATVSVGGMLGIPVGYGVAAATHYARRIFQFAESKTVENPPRNLTELKVTYDPTSTGWGGYAIGLISQLQGGMGRGSRTVGTVAINIGNEAPAIYHFNRNSSSDQGKMNDKDIIKLNDDLKQQLEEGKLSPQECLVIIESLANVETEHGFIACVAPDTVFLRDLKRECERNIAKNNERM